MKGMFNFFSKRAETNVESRNYSNIYLILSGLLFIGTMWSVVDEISTRRPWKEYQAEYFKLSEQKWNQRLNDESAAFDTAAYAQLKNELNEAEAKLHSPEFVNAEKEINSIDEELLDVNRAYTFAKSLSDEAYYFWKKSIHEGAEDKGAKEKLDKYSGQMKVSNARVEELTARHDSLNVLVKQYKGAVKDVNAKISTLYLNIDNAKTKIEKVLASSILIRQVMLNNFDRTNFGTPKARIDRCQTCHTGWNDENMTDAPQPFTKHPVPELLQIHKPEQFGCTTCHHGQGAALTAGFAHGDEDHYWEWPLLKGKEVYASCNSCHLNETYVKYGDRINKSKEMLLESGCFGCHEIKGYTQVAKIGPELNQLAAKTKPEWIFRWVRNPKDYNPHTRMPNFRFNDEQAEAITAYLWNNGTESKYRPAKGISAGGNAERGKALVETIGCKGCHVVGDDTRMRDARGYSYDIAPELSRAASKLDPDWIYEWIKNPRQYRPETKMPSLRLTDQEARDIVAYLTTMRDGRQFEQKKLTLDDPAIIKRGDKLIREYGCAGCHAVKGMEKEGRVSVALSNFGRKRVDELDFGDTKVHHTWDDWVFGKIKDARQYTTDRIISKMPVFGFADSEIVSLRTLLRGFAKEEPDPVYLRTFDKNHQDIETGRRLTSYYNCINCHQIEEIGGAVKATLDDEGMAPPYLFPEGSKVQEEWLHEFLKGPQPIRPWLKLRMPTFSLTDDEITTITKYFLALHKEELKLKDYKAYQPDPKYVSVGKQLFSDLQCLSCHYTGKIPEGKGPADLAPNLAMASGRLKPEWIAEWIAKPDSIQPGTRMPSFYPELKEPSPYSQDFGGDAKEQIKAIREYVVTIGKQK